MVGAFRLWFARHGFRRASLVAVGLAALAGGVWFGHGLIAQQTPTDPPPSRVAAPAQSTSDYTARVVAYIHGSTAITRQDLGEYLIQRYGYEKLPLLVNKRITEDACQQRGVNVTAADVEAAFQEDLKGLALDKDSFVRTVLTRYKKTLYEWKEDMLRPRIQMTRLASPRISVSQEDLKKAYESAYGEKVECRMILWPAAKQKDALEAYGKLRGSEAEFDKAARAQETGWLAGAAGKIKPIGRWAMSEDLEKEAFRLQPGQVSTLVKTPEGIVLLKCDKRLPADTTVAFDTVKDKLEKEIRDNKIKVEIGAVFHTLKEQAKPQLVLAKNERVLPGPTPAPTEVVAHLHNAKPITREDLGEFLIARMGAEKLEFLVNRRIIDRECASRNVVATDADVDKALEDYLKLLACDKQTFESKFLAQYGKTVYEWREDVLRPQLLLNGICQGRVQVSEEELKKGFESYYGERLKCRVILWPLDQRKFAMAEYGRIRDSEAEFAKKAKNQATPSLSSQGGELPPFGRHAMGDETLEREAFKLQPGEVTTLLQTAQGHVVIKCDQRIPPDKTATLEQAREKLTKEIREKKLQQEMQVVFKDLRDKAKPQLILKSTGKPEDLLAETNRIMSDLPPLGGSR